MEMSRAVRENLEPMQRKFYIRLEQLRMAQLHCNEYRAIVDFIRIYSFSGCNCIFNKRTFQSLKYCRNNDFIKCLQKDVQNKKKKRENRENTQINLTIAQ